MAPSFSIISPDGRQLSRDGIIKRLYGAYQLNPGIRISIERVKLQFQSADYIVAVYEEWQIYQEVERARLSSVFFQRAEDRLLWLHVHETWLPSPESTNT